MAAPAQVSPLVVTVFRAKRMLPDVPPPRLASQLSALDSLMTFSSIARAWASVSPGIRFSSRY